MARNYFRVPQCSIIGPFLFNIFLADLFFIVNDIEISNYADINTSYVSGKDIQSWTKYFKTFWYFSKFF